MRVETTKNNQPDKKDTMKTEKSLFDPSNQVKTIDSSNPATTTGAFEKILKETRQDSAREKDKDTNGKSGASESASKSSESDEKREINRKGEIKEKIDNKNNEGSDRGDKRDSDEDHSAAFAPPISSPEVKSPVNIATPAARSILHVADLERIISTVRSQDLANAKQVTIALKNSVLEGLQIKLTLTESGNLKAEFLAANEQIKKKLKEREKELLDVLKQRSSKFSEIDILLG